MKSRRENSVHNNHSMPARPLTIVSNRLPVLPKYTDNTGWRLDQSSGGLIKALDPLLRQCGGCWLGWSGIGGSLPVTLRDLFQERYHTTGYKLQAVELSEAEIDGFYSGFSNGCIWPLFHNQLTRCIFNPDYWQTYCSVNERFAHMLAECREGQGLIWIHDYHLMLCGRALRKLGVAAPLAFFLHIPFPPMDTYMALPWRREILDALMDFDLLGFQTDRDRDNFLDCVNRLPGIECVTGGESLVCIRRQRQSQDSKRPGETLVGTFPISVDFQALSRQSDTTSVKDFAKHLKDGVHGRTLIFGAARLDYSKGLLQRMKGYQRLLRQHPELHNKVSFVQYVVPGRETVPEYQQLHEDIERLVGEIDGEFTQLGWVPLQYIYRKLNTEQLLAYYRAADIALVTPVRDGMNLVAKEYCAARTDEDGVLVLSEFAGAARELVDGALIVNPYDEQQIAESLYQACIMPIEERSQRMRLMRGVLRDGDIHHWMKEFLSAIPEHGGDERIRARPRSLAT